MAAIQRAQPYRHEPTLTTLNSGHQELLFLPANEVAPPGRMKYEFGTKNEDYQHNCARCPLCHLFLTKRIGLYARSPGLIPKDNQVPKEQIPKADTFECSAAVHWQEAEKRKIPMSKLCPNCSQDQQLMSLVNHNCPTSNVEVSLMSLQSCESCEFHANYICKCAYCSVAKHAKTWQYVANPTADNPFPLYPGTADEVNIHNKKLSDGYEVKKKNNEKKRPLVNNFSNLYCCCGRTSQLYHE